MEGERMQPLVQMREIWTAEDVRALDLDEWWRYEVVDGALVVSPPTAGLHELVSAEVRAPIWAARPPGLVVVGPIGVKMRRSYFVPDLVVASRARVHGSSLLDPADVLLAVEIVSPGSVTMDRLIKPARYAASGIRAYWRVETEPVTLTAYVLPDNADVYTEVGSWGSGEVAHLAEPFAVSLELDRLAAPD